MDRIPQVFRGISLLSMAGELNCPLRNKRGFFSSIFEAEEGGQEEEEDRKEDEVILEQELAFSSPQPVCILSVFCTTFYELNYKLLVFT